MIGRQDLTAPITVTFQLEHQGELINISKEGLALKFNPAGSGTLTLGKKLRVNLDMNGRIVSLQGEIKRLSEEDGQMILGLEYDREEITLFDFN